AGLVVYAPDGTTAELGKTLEKVTLVTADKKQATGYRFRFTPKERGDYTFVLTTPPIWMEEEKEYWKDTVRVVLHVQAQKGWGQAAGGPLRRVPRTRPYGLLPGMVLQAQVLEAVGAKGDKVRPVAGTLVEVERYSPKPPAPPLPPDEHITRTA